MTILQYLDLITSAWREKPKYTAMISSDVSLQVRVQDLMGLMRTTLFDVDLAVGDQLDILGKWVGITRNVNIPITGIFFSWNDENATGWEFGIWRATNQPDNITTIPDDVYRTLIKAKIAANQWDGTTTGMYAIWDILFPNLTILVVDHQDMSYGLAFVGTLIDSLTLAIMTGGYLPLKPEGVRINEFFIPVNTGPLFGWDLETDLVAGWGDGSWAREIPGT